MDANNKPILVVPAIPSCKGIKFLHGDGSFEIDSKLSETVWAILGYANGYNNVAFIASATGIDKNTVVEILSELEVNGLVIDARYQYKHFHYISSYPTAINSDLTQREIEAYTGSARIPAKEGKVIEFATNTQSKLSSLIKARRSCRNFSNEKLTLNQIGNLCYHAYSIREHSVPSGGALYPLKIYVLIESEQIGIDPGYYEYDAEENYLVLYNEEVDIEQIKYCFNQEEMPFGSSVQIVIAGDLDRQPYKYANRGYRLTLIEVGHVAENICLSCSEQNIGACEMGGVQDEPLKRELDLPGSIWPLLAIAIGYPADDIVTPFNKIAFVEEKIGSDKPVTDIWTNVFGDNGSFFGAGVSYLDDEKNVQYAGATSPSYADAIFKATIEGYERWLSGLVRTDFYGSAHNIKKRWLSPSAVAPLTYEQALAIGVKPFSEDLEISWTKGSDTEGKDVYIPSDLVYYGQRSGENRIYYGNSSGIAAHFDLDKASKRATIELVERDALMRNWFFQNPAYELDERILPTHAKKRIQHWYKQNRNMHILQIPSEFGYVFETVITSETYPCFSSGAAAAIEVSNIEDAITKSMQEAEYILLLAMRFPNLDYPKAEDVLTPDDHGRFYYSRENASKIQWIWEGNSRINQFIDPIIKDDYTRLCEEYLKPIVVDLSKPKCDIKVVRIISTALVPINFGFYSAHYTHPSIISAGGAKPHSLELPHYFA